MDTRLSAQSLRRDSTEIWSAAGFCMWHRAGRLHNDTRQPARANKLQTDAKLAKKAKTNLDTAYSYLGGNAFGRDNKGRIKKDDSAMSAEMQQAGHPSDQEYTAYVYYDFEVV